MDMDGFKPLGFGIGFLFSSLCFAAIWQQWCLGALAGLFFVGLGIGILMSRGGDGHGE